MEQPILVYTEHISERLLYITCVLFGDKVAVTNSLATFQSFEGGLINYSANKTGNDAVWIVPHGLLSQTDIQEQPIHCTEWKRHKIFFQSSGELPFDIFAASFYLLSRYEEYLPYEPDEYGRFPYTAGIAFREGFLHLPLVNIWLDVFKLYLNGRFPYVRLSLQSSFRFIPTYDIDEAYRFHSQPVWKNVLSFFRQLVAGNFEKVTEASYIYSGKQRDPFDIYDWLDALHADKKIRPVYFFLVAEKRSKYDRNISPRKKEMKKLIGQHADTYSIGVHPSWQSGDDPVKLLKEKQVIEKITGQPITVSRQHYLRMQLPETYRRLSAAGIRDDYSMGYGNHNGFRASYTSAYAWYDLPNETVTALQVHPFCFMDSCSIFHQHDSSYDAGKELEELYDVVKNVQGDMITVFHNHLLTDQEEWREWRMMYERFIAYTTR